MSLTAIPSCLSPRRVAGPVQAEDPAVSVRVRNVGPHVSAECALSIGDGADPHFYHRQGAALVRQVRMIWCQISGGQPFTDQPAEFTAQKSLALTDRRVFVSDYRCRASRLPSHGATPVGRHRLLHQLDDDGVFLSKSGDQPVIDSGIQDLRRRVVGQPQDVVAADAASRPARVRAESGARACFGSGTYRCICASAGWAY